MKKNMLLVAALPAVLAGCATTLYEGKYNPQEGWRRGVVVDNKGNVGAYPPVTVDCRKEATKNAPTQFATVKYYHMHFWRTGVFPVAPGAPLANREEVYVNIRDCNLPAAQHQDKK